jgi:hypothetical protein
MISQQKILVQWHNPFLIQVVLMSYYKIKYQEVTLRHRKAQGMDQTQRD